MPGGTAPPDPDTDPKKYIVWLYDALAELTGADADSDGYACDLLAEQRDAVYRLRTEQEGE